MDLTAIVIVRHAFETYATAAAAKDSLTFRDLWSVHLSARPHPVLPLLPKLRWLTLAIGLRDILVYYITGITGFVSPQLRNECRWRALDFMRYDVQSALVHVLASFDVELSMTDGTSHTTVAWQRHVREVGALVNTGTPPRGRGQEKHTDPPPGLYAPRSPRWKQMILGAPLCGYILDLAFVITFSLMTAWLSVWYAETIEHFYTQAPAPCRFQASSIQPALQALEWDEIFHFTVSAVYIIKPMTASWVPFGKLGVVVFGIEALRQAFAASRRWVKCCQEADTEIVEGSKGAIDLLLMVVHLAAALRTVYN